MGDEPIFERVADTGFVDLYDRSVTDVYSYLFSRLRDRGMAEDLTQEVFLAGARRAAGGQRVELPWLVAVARNKLVDHWRAAGREERKLRSVEMTVHEPDTAPMALDHTRAAAVLQQLNPTYRLALVLRHVDELPVPQVAEHLGRTVAATEQILSRARAAFRREHGEPRHD